MFSLRKKKTNLNYVLLSGDLNGEDSVNYVMPKTASLRRNVCLSLLKNCVRGPQLLDGCFIRRCQILLKPAKGAVKLC